MDPTKNGADPLLITNPFAYSTGDLLILVEPASGKNCSVMEVNKISSNQITHDLSTYLAAGSARIPRFNPNGGLGVVYQGVGTANVARAFNLGNLYYVAPGRTAPVNLPVYNVYAIANGTLTATSQFQIANGQPAVTAVADNVVHMRALYGLDDGINDGVTVTYNVGAAVKGDGIVDRYVDAATFNALAPVPWANLIAVRIAVVSRSALPEKPSSGQLSDPCDATVSEPQWTGSPWAAAPLSYKTRLDVSAIVAAPDNWKCYRYRVFETTIPLRNWIWKAS
jgi:type IV pilus assembly protein PilW